MTHLFDGLAPAHRMLQLKTAVVLNMEGLVYV